MSDVAGYTGTANRAPLRRRRAKGVAAVGSATERRQRQAERLIAAWHAAHQEVLRISRMENLDPGKWGSGGDFLCPETGPTRRLE